jgi:hypothetical protein
MEINNKFNIGECVFLITDDDQKTRMVTEILIGNNVLTYKLSCGTSESWHSDFEIVKEKNYLI